MKEDINLEKVSLIAQKYLDWGLTKNMRAITIGIRNNDQLVFRAYTDNKDTIDYDTDSLSNMGVYVWSMLSDEYKNQWSECVPTLASLDDLENLGIWLYKRENGN